MLTKHQYFEKPITDHWINAEAHLPQGENLKGTRVIGRSKDKDGLTVETNDNNPYLNTMTYDVKFPDGEVKEYNANVIAENMFAEVDTDSHTQTMLDSITDFKKDKSIVKRSSKKV